MSLEEILVDFPNTKLNQLAFQINLQFLFLQRTYIHTRQSIQRNKEIFKRKAEKAENAVAKLHTLFQPLSYRKMQML